MRARFDVVVIGGGPAGLAAAIYLARAKYRVLVLERERFGGQIALTEEVVNYPGIASVSGAELGETMRAQAERFGAELWQAEATALSLSQRIKTVSTTRGEVECLGVLLATGARPKRIGFRGEEEYRGRGVAYCATCDGEFFTGREIFVIGGGYAAAEESVFLTKFARHVTVFIRRDDFSCAASVAEKAKQHEKITVLPHTVVEEVAGEGGLHYLRYRNTETGEVTEYRSAEDDPFGVFVLAGREPDTALAADVAERNEQGYLLTDATQKTSCEGLYAAGDVCVKALRQVVTATADGALAATELEKYVAAMQREVDFHADPPVARSVREDIAADDPLAEMRPQLTELLSRLHAPLRLELHLDERPISEELRTLMTSLAASSDRLSVHIAAPAQEEDRPFVRICRDDGSETGLFFHGVPGGHEFTSFLLGLAAAANEGDSPEDPLRARLAALHEKTELKVLVTLSCTLCPELVTGALRLAAAHPQLSTHVYDIRHFEPLRQRYEVMSVPCLVINDTDIHFGRKTTEQLLSLLGL